MFRYLHESLPVPTEGESVLAQVRGETIRPIEQEMIPTPGNSSSFVTVSQCLNSAPLVSEILINNYPRNQLGQRR